MKDLGIVILVIMGLFVALYSAYVLIALAVGFVVWLALPTLRSIIEFINPPKKYKWKY